MRWSYKTVHYESKKEGLLGSAFLDESEIEISLNEYGRAGWELVSLLETLDGLIAVFKLQLSEQSDSFQVSTAPPVPRADVPENTEVSVEAPSEVEELTPVDRELLQAESISHPVRDLEEDDFVVEEQSNRLEKVDVGSIRIE